MNAPLPRLHAMNAAPTAPDTALPTPPPLVVCEAVGKQFQAKGEPALQGVSLTLRPGEMLALLGHNGAGKTTLMKLILGLIRPSHGQIRVLDHDPASAAGREARGALGFLPESVVFQGNMSGLETLRFFARLKGLDVAQCPAMLARVRLAEEAWRRPLRTYSKGMRQRVGLAQALLGAPRLLLLDEPTTGLDPSLRRLFYQLLQERREAGAAVILSSHQLAEVERHCQRVLILRQGRMVASGDLETLRRASGLPVVVVATLAHAGGLDPATLPEGVAWQWLSSHRLRLQLPAAGVPPLLRQLAECTEALEVHPPTLEAIYFHPHPTQEEAAP